MHLTPYAVDNAESAYRLRQKPSADLRRLASHFDHTAPLASVAQNRRDSEAIAAACRRILSERGEA